MCKKHTWAQEVALEFIFEYSSGNSGGYPEAVSNFSGLSEAIADLSFCNCQQCGQLCNPIWEIIQATMMFNWNEIILYYPSRLERIKTHFQAFETFEPHKIIQKLG